MFKANPSNTYIPAKSVSVKPEAQVPYGVSNNEVLLNQIKFNIPSYLGFIDPRETYLKFKITMSGRGKPKPDPRGGCHSLISSFVIQDGSGSQTLEEIQDYNCLVNTWWDYSSNKSINDKRDMYEGRSASKNQDAQLYYGSAPAPTATGFESGYSSIKQPEILLSLNSGILGGSKVFPVVATKGLKMSINLARLQHALTLDQGNAGMADTLSLHTGNNWCRPKAGADKPDDSDEKAGITSVFTIALHGSPGAGFGVNLNNAPFNNNPFEVGDRFYISEADGTNENSLGIITGFQLDGDGNVVVQYCPERATGAKLPFIYADTARLYVKNEERVRGLTYTAFTDPATQKNNTPWGYKIEDLELICSVISPPEVYINKLMAQVNSSEGLQLDIKSYHTYRENISLLNGLYNNFIPASETRAYSILSVPVYNTNLGDNTTSTWRGGCDGIQNYQYIFGGQQIPDRVIDMRRYSPNTGQKVEALHLIELEKSLVNCGISVRDIQRVPERFLIGRGFSKYNQVFDLSKRDLSLRLEYSGLTDDGSGDKTMYNFVCHLKRVVINANGLQVIW